MNHGDLQNQSVIGYTQVIAKVATTSFAGDVVDLGLCDGPTTLVCGVGAATGSPTGQSVTWTLQECATTGGTFTNISGAAAAAMTADKDVALVTTFKRAERYVKTNTVVAFTGGSSPAIPLTGLIMGCKKLQP